MPRPITKRTTATLMVTMVALNRALSLMPMTRIAVIIRAITNAGRLNPISWPKMAGAVNTVGARRVRSGARAASKLAAILQEAWGPGGKVATGAVFLSTGAGFVDV